MLRGSLTALITPMRVDGTVDEAAFSDLIEWHISCGTHGIVPVGTTGESATLSHDEHKSLVSLAVRTSGGRIPIIAGAGSNSTSEAVDLARHAESAGADYVLVVAPYYNKPSQEGLFRHYGTIADSVGLPVIVYNVPGRTSSDVLPSTLARLFEGYDRIVGVKDATGDLARVSEMRRLCGADLIQLSGEDATALGFMSQGGHGCISVTANVAPHLCSLFQSACLDGNFSSALDYQDRLYPLHDALFLEPSPQGAKYGVSLLGRCTPHLRLPLISLPESACLSVKRAMIHAGILSNN